ncbi:MAG: peptidylprolyl isomerase [Pseudomonadota bacterium]|nr:peptidylprolyl isomerase [Pseudomonadota bacterium]
MNRFAVLFALIAAFVVSPSVAGAQQINSPLERPQPQMDVRIAAVVNDNIISTVDLEARIRLAMLSSGLPATQEVVHRLLPQVLHGLIDEQLQLQEAKRLDITISHEEIDKTLERIGEDNHIPGDMKSYVASHGVPVESLVSQIRGALAWNRVIQRELRPHVEVGDDEVDSAIERIRANAGKEEYLVSEIFLAVDTPQDEDQVRQFAENVTQQLKDGASFAAVARQFSQGTGAAGGGDIGWIQEGQMPTELNKTLVTMKPGEIAGPIRSANGFHILGLKEKRTIAASSAGPIKLSLQQAFRPFDAGAGKEAILQEAEHMRATISSCGTLPTQFAEHFPAWHLQGMGEVDMSKLPSWIADKVRDLPVGKPSEALPTDKGGLVFFVCERHVPDGSIDRNTVVASIGTEKLELQARRLLRDLRRQAYIDIRLPSAP